MLRAPKKARRDGSSLKKPPRAKRPLSRKNARAEPTTKRKPGEIIISLVIALFVTAVLSLSAFTMLSFTLPSLKVALGMTGIPGTATVASCEELGYGRDRARHCKADFIFDDPARSPIFVDTVPDAKVGGVFRAALDVEGDRVLPTGTRGVMPQLALFSVALLSLAFVPALLLWALNIERALRAAMIGGYVIATVSGLLAVLGMTFGG